MKTDKFGDLPREMLAVVYDENNHDYVEHYIKVKSIEYENENITMTNPEGMIGYGTDLTDQNEVTMIATVTESNFVRFVTEQEKCRLVAEAILGHCGMGIDAEAPYSFHVKSLTKAVETCPERLRDWLSNILEGEFPEGKYYKEALERLDPLPTEEDHSEVYKTTEYGTRYGDIAQWIVALIIVGGTGIHEYTDDTFYLFICEDLEESSPELRYYLSDAVENTLQAMKHQPSI